MLELFRGAIVRNPKSSIGGLGGIVSTLLLAFGLITLEQSVAITSASVSLGLILSADAK